MKKKIFYSFLVLLILITSFIGLHTFLSFLLLTLFTVFFIHKIDRGRFPVEQQILLFFSSTAVMLILSNLCSSFFRPEAMSPLHSWLGVLAESLIFLSAALAVAIFIASSFCNGRTASFVFLLIGLFLFLGDSAARGYSGTMILFFFIYGLSRSFMDWPSQRFKLWLFLGILAGWAFFLTMREGALFDPTWCTVLLPSSPFFESLIQVIFSVSLAFTLFLPLSLILGSRKTRMKTTTAYIFLSVIPIIILVSLIWLNFYLQMRIFPLFLLWRENVGTVQNLTAKLSVELERTLRNAAADEKKENDITPLLSGLCQKYEDLLSFQYSVPSVFVTLASSDSRSVLAGASSRNAAHIRPSEILHPEWFKEEKVAWVFQENQKLFLKGVRRLDLGQAQAYVRIYIPLEFQNLNEISPGEYQFFLQLDQRPDTARETIGDVREGVSLPFQHAVQTFYEGRIPLPGLNWENGNFFVAGSLLLPAPRFLPGTGAFPAILYWETLGILIMSSFFAFLIIVFSSILGYIINRNMRKSFDAIVEGAHRFSRGDFDHEIRMVSRDEHSMVAGALNQMALGIKKYTKELIKKEIMERDLSIASEIQKKIFPQIPPSVEGMDFGIVCRLAGKVGGDYYDFIDYSDHEMAVVIADATGSGIPAALMISSLNAILHSYARPERLTDFLALLNARLHKVSTENTYISLVFSMFHRKEDEIRYVNAGHPYPLLLKENGSFVELKEGGVSLGMLDAIDLREGCVTMRAGEALIFMTDGVLEAANEAGEEFGSGRLKEIVLKNQTRDAQGIAESLFEELRAFTGQDRLTDDATCIIIKKL